MLTSNKITVMENENSEKKIKSVSDYLQWLKQACKALAVNPFDFMKMLKDIRSDYRLYTPEQTVRRAESRLGEATYNLALNNCESYAMWCKTGVNISYQTMNALLLLGPLFPELVISRYAAAAYSLCAVDVFALPSAIKKQFMDSSLAKDIEYIKNLRFDDNEGNSKQGAHNVRPGVNSVLGRRPKSLKYFFLTYCKLLTIHCLLGYQTGSFWAGASLKY